MEKNPDDGWFSYRVTDDTYLRTGKAMAHILQKNKEVALEPSRWLQDYGVTLYRHAFRRLRDGTQAEDVVQETLLAALETRAGYAGRASEKTWLIGILKHKIADSIRQQMREAPVADIQTLSDAAADSGVDDLFEVQGCWIHPPRDWGDPDKALHNSELVETFGHCLAQLKPAQAEVFSLKELAGESTGEICHELGITETNCNVLLYRARRGLRRCIAAHLADDGLGTSE
jgi:RNA polymerase sigma-70 factor (ECF subfamily)